MLAEKDKVKEVGEEIREDVLTAFRDSKTMPWPPTSEFINKKDVLPKKFESFLSFLLFGKKDNLSTKMNRILLSLGQDKL